MGEPGVRHGDERLEVHRGVVIPLTRPPPARGRLLLERDAELAELEEAAALAASGSGGLYFVSGEPGIGKTRLLAELGGRVRGVGLHPVWGRAWEGGGAPAYYPWREVLRGVGEAPATASHRSATARVAGLLAHGQPERAGDPTGAFRVHEIVTTFLCHTATVRPLLVVLDDVHAADESSLLLLQFLARSLLTARLLVVATFRDAELRASPSRAAIVSDLLREGRHLVLDGLSEEGISALLAARAGIVPTAAQVERLARASGGNPFFLDQVLGVLQGRLDDPDVLEQTPLAVPAVLGDVVRRRLDGLSLPARRLLERAAVLGRDFCPTLLAGGGESLEDVVGHLAEAAAIGLVDWDPARGQYRFRHVLFRQTLYQDLQDIRRRHLHLEFATRLEALPEGDDRRHLAEIAHHRWEAGELSEAAATLEALCRAGGHASKLNAHREAAARYERAVALADRDGLDPRRVGGLLLDLGQAQWRAGAPAAARASYERAAECALLAADAVLLAEAALGYGTGLGGFGFVDSADGVLVGLLSEALANLDPGDSVLRARVMARLAIELYYTRHAQRRVELAREAVAMAERLGDERALLVARYAREVAQLGPDGLERRLAVAERILSAALRLGDVESALRAAHLHITGLLELGRAGEVDGELERYERLAAQLAQPLYQWQHLLLRASRARMRGHFEEAERLAQRALETGRECLGDSATLLVGVQLCLQRWTEGRLAEVAPAIVAFAQQYPLSAWRSTRLATAAELGQEEQTRAAFEQVAAHEFADLPRDGNWLVTVALLAIPCALLGDARRAALLLRLLEPYAGRVLVGSAGAAVFGAVDSYLGLLAATAGHHEQAERWYASGLERNLSAGDLPFSAWTLCQHARLLADNGRQDEAVAMVERATVLAPDLVRAQQRLPARPVLPGTVAPNDCALLREGEYWTILFDGRVSRMRDGKGMRYLAVLLAEPDREFHALDLVLAQSPLQDAAGHGEQLAAEGQGHAGPLLDPQGRRAYRLRLQDLHAELEEAQANHDLERAARAKVEIDALRQELARAVGLGGRQRVSGSPVERARVSVTKRVKSTVRRIAEADERLGRHLSAAVRTGTYCSYRPDPRSPVRWRT